MNHIYLASKSYSRRYLLTEAQIPFKVIDQQADEQKCDWNLPITQVVANIAAWKMHHAQLPTTGEEFSTIYVVTADTLCQDVHGTIHGKPTDYADAVHKLKILRDGCKVITSFVLEKKMRKNGSWHSLKTHQEVVVAECVFYVPDNWIETYFRNHPIALQAAGALAIEQYGLQFLRSINGSYSALIGLPIFELRQALDAYGFFETV